MSIQVQGRLLAQVFTLSQEADGNPIEGLELIIDGWIEDNAKELTHVSIGIMNVDEDTSIELYKRLKKGEPVQTTVTIEW